MKFDFGTAITAVAVGGVDEGMVYLNEKQGYSKPFQNAVDLGRVGMVVVGLGVQMFAPKFDNYGETIANSGLTLLTKSVVQTIRHGIGRPAARRVAYGAMPHSVRETAKPEFEGIKAA